MGPVCALVGPTLQAQAVAHALAAGSAVMMLGPALGGISYGVLGHEHPALAPSLIGAGRLLIASISHAVALYHQVCQTRVANQGPTR